MAIYLTAIRMLGRLILEWFRATPPARPRVTWIRRVVFGLALLGIVCIAYGFWIEPYWPQVTVVSLSTPKLPPGARPIRIVHISDVHCDPTPRLEERLPGLIQRQHPDLIVFTGDSINSPQALPVFKRCMAHCAQIAPTFAVKGNCDVWFWKGQDLFGGTGVRELNGEAVKLDLSGEKAPLWITGVAVESEDRIDQALAEVPKGALNIFLYHYPDRIFSIAQHKVDLYCAGHTHGGQVALPFYGALVTLSKLGKRFEAGLYRVDETWLYVNRGIGMEIFAPRVRFCARPEITVIELVPRK